MNRDTDPTIPLRALKALCWLVVYGVIGWWAWRLLGAVQGIAEGVR